MIFMMQRIESFSGIFQEKYRRIKNNCRSLNLFYLNCLAIYENFVDLRKNRN